MYPIGKWPPPPILPLVSVVDNRLNSLQMEEGAELLPIQNTALVQVFISGFKLSAFFAEGWDVLSWAPTANCRLSVEQCADGGGGWAFANPQDCFGPGGHLKIQFVITSCHISVSPFVCVSVWFICTSWWSWFRPLSTRWKAWLALSTLLRFDKLSRC